MSTENAEPRISAWKLWRRNGLIWAALLLLLLLSLVLAYVPNGIVHPDRRHRDRLRQGRSRHPALHGTGDIEALIRLAAVAGVVFLAALFALTLADVLSRLGTF